MSSQTDDNTFKLSPEEAQFIEVLADLVEQWGFKRHLGRVWGILYVRQTPLSPSHIQDLLGLSVGNTHQVMHELQTWGVIKRVRVAQDRKSYFVADDQIWKSISNVLKARELRILSEAVTHLERLETSSSSFQRERIHKVKETLSLIQSLTQLMLQASPKSLDRLARVLDKLHIL